MKKSILIVIKVLALIYLLSAPFLGKAQDARLEASGIKELRTGMVLSNKDPKRVHRVKVKFPWIRGQKKVRWVPVLRNFQRGSFVLPEVGDEVIVSFINGDPNRPVVLGRLWNGKDRPPSNR